MRFLIFFKFYFLFRYNFEYIVDAALDIHYQWLNGHDRLWICYQITYSRIVSSSFSFHSETTKKFSQIQVILCEQMDRLDSSNGLTGINSAATGGNNSSSSLDIQWAFSQVKGSLDDDATEADIISCVEFNDDGELLATGDKGGRVVIFHRDDPQDYGKRGRTSDYSVYTTFQSHEPEFDYLKSLEIEEKINKIRWLKRRNPAHFLLSTNDKTIKLWKVSERDKKIDGMYNIRDDDGFYPNDSTSLMVPQVKSSDLIVEASPRRVYANAHTYHVNSISVNSDQETYLSADDLRINLWHLDITNESFNIVDVKPLNMDELNEVITAAEFHPTHCNYFVYSSSKGAFIRSFIYRLF